MSVASIIEQKLSAALSPTELEVIDESHKHQGHVGARPEGETHFLIRVVAEGFRGKSRIDCHRVINQVLEAELAGPVHALSINARAPE